MRGTQLKAIDYSSKFYFLFCQWKLVLYTLGYNEHIKWGNLMQNQFLWIEMVSGLIPVKCEVYLTQGCCFVFFLSLFLGIWGKVGVFADNHIFPHLCNAEKFKIWQMELYFEWANACFQLHWREEMWCNVSSWSFMKPEMSLIRPIIFDCSTSCLRIDREEE